MTESKSSLSPFHGVFFDLDGTLADTAPDLVAATNQLLLARNLAPKPYEVLRPHASAGARGLLEGAFGITPDHADFIDLRDEFYLNYEKALLVHSKLFDGMDDLLEQMEAANIPWGKLGVDIVVESTGIFRISTSITLAADAIEECASALQAITQRPAGVCFLRASAFYSKISSLFNIPK